MGLAKGWPTTEMPYSTSVPMTRRTDMVPAYGYGRRVGWWSERVVPRVNDKSLSAKPVMELRREVCRGLTGRVLEIGFSSGLNLGCYPDSVTAVDAVEPSDVGWKLSRERR